METVPGSHVTSEFLDLELAFPRGLSFPPISGYLSVLRFRISTLPVLR